MSVPSYTPEELATRIQDGSIDLNRLAATLAAAQETLAATVSWVNGQIQAANDANTAATNAGSPNKAKR